MLGDTLVGSRKIIHTSFFAGQKTSAYLRSHEHTNKDFPIARIESVAFVCWWPTTGKICSFPRGPIGFCPNGFFAVVSHPSSQATTLSHAPRTPCPNGGTRVQVVRWLVCLLVLLLLGRMSLRIARRLRKRYDLLHVCLLIAD